MQSVSRSCLLRRSHIVSTTSAPAGKTKRWAAKRSPS